MTLDRRTFLKTTGAATVAGASLIRPRASLGASETVNIGCIGTGGRCRQLMQQVREIAGARMIAVCDLWDWALEEGKNLAEPGAFATKHYEELLARKDIDAVLIGTPDHWHVPVTLDALAAGKDVYVEKPLTHDLSEGEAVIQAQNEGKRVLQVGQQQRSMEHLREAHEKYIRTGALGKVHQVRVFWNRSLYDFLAAGPLDLHVDESTVDWKTWLRNAEPRPFDVQQFRQWRFYWDFGGGILTDLMVHFMDVVNWYLQVEMAQTAAASGGSYFNQQGWDTPDTINAIYTYPNDLSVVFHGTFANGAHGAGIEFQGQKGTLYVDRGRYEFHTLDPTAPPESRIMDDKPIGTDETRPHQDRAHLQNWIDCIRTREKPHCPAETGVWAAGTAHMGNIAYKTGTVYRREG